MTLSQYAQYECSRVAEAATTASATTLIVTGYLLGWYFLASLVAMATAAAAGL